MTARLACPPAPGPLEEYAAEFDSLFKTLAQRRGFREYLTGLLQPRERNKTLTALAGAEPVVEATHAAVQRLHHFVSESRWDADAVNDRRIKLLAADPATAPHGQGVLVIDDTGHRKDGHTTAFVARQYLGSVGKTDNGIVVVSTLWADERMYYPLDLAPYTPAGRLPRSRTDPDFATKPQLAVQLAERAREAGIPFAAVVADSWYGDNPVFAAALHDAGLPFVIALKPNVERKHDDTTTKLVETAKALGWRSKRRPGAWQQVTRRFRDGHVEVWWAAEARLAGWGPDEAFRLVITTSDPRRLPAHSTWYLLTNRPRPGGPRAADSPHQPADLAEVVRCYGLRNWVEQGYKQVKQELGWTDFQVRSATAIRRHLTLVCTAFSFSWRDWFADAPPDSRADRRERGDHESVHSGQPDGIWVGPDNEKGTLAGNATPGPSLAEAGHTAATLLARLVERAPATSATSPVHRSRRRSADIHLPRTPALTNHR